jgi:hypothetical protein
MFHRLRGIYQSQRKDFVVNVSPPIPINSVEGFWAIRSHGDWAKVAERAKIMRLLLLIVSYDNNLDTRLYTLKTKSEELKVIYFYSLRRFLLSLGIFRVKISCFLAQHSKNKFFLCVRLSKRFKTSFSSVLIPRKFNINFSLLTFTFNLIIQLYNFPFYDG